MIPANVTLVLKDCFDTTPLLIQKKTSLIDVFFYSQLRDGINRANFQRDFLKFTARSLLNFMRMHDDPILKALKVDAADRQFQIWERNSLSIDLFTEKVFLQKLDYVHNNPVQPKWALAALPELYRWSSAGFYETGKTEFRFLTHYRS